MQVQAERHPGLLVFRIAGDLRLWNHPEAEARLQTALRSGLKEAPEQLVLNLGGLTHLDSLGIGSLVRIAAHCAREQIGLRVVMPSGITGEVLTQIRVFAGWPTFADEPTALGSAA